MKGLLCLLSLLYCCKADAQPKKFAWTFMLDGYNDVMLADLVLDSAGNTYIGANYTSPLEIPGLTKKLPNPGHVHGLLIKLDKNGKALWAHPFKSGYDNRIKDLALAPNGDVLITGFGDGLLHFPGLHDTLKAGIEKEVIGGSRTLYQGFYAARYAPDGERKWVQYFNTPWGEGLSIAANNRNEVFMAFYYGGTMKQGNHLIDSIPIGNNRDYRYGFAKMNGNGKIISIQKQVDIKSDGYTLHTQMQFDYEDNLLLFGTFRGRIDLTPKDSLTNITYTEGLDSYVAKYNAKGNLLWSKKIGGQNSQVINDIAIAPDNSIYATGSYDYECILGDGVSVLRKSKFEYKSGSSLFYFHLFSDGELDFINYQDNKGWSAYVNGNNIAFDENGNTHIVGYFTDTLRIDGHQLATPHDFYTGVYTSWKGNRLQEMTKIADSIQGFLFAWQIDIQKQFYAIGGEYSSNSGVVSTPNGMEALSHKDYGRVAYVFGGTLEETPDTASLITIKDARETRKEIVKTLTACTAASEPAADVWLALDVAQTKSPCGNEVKGMEVSIFPNPTSGVANIKLVGITGATQIEVFTEKGQLVLSHRLEDVVDGQLVTLDLHRLSNGAYVVRITNGRFQKGLKLIKIG